MNPTRLANCIQGRCDGCGAGGNVLQVVAVTAGTPTIRICPDCIDFAKVVVDRELAKARYAPSAETVNALAFKDELNAKLDRAFRDSITGAAPKGESP